MNALPFSRFSLTGSRPKPSGYPSELRTIGDHIRKKRFDLGLTQNETAQKVGVDTTTVYNWERMGVKSNLRAMPKIIEFLGYNPLQTREACQPQTLGEQLRFQRLTLGLTQKEAARKIGIDQSTLAHWEQGKHKPRKRLLESTKLFLKEYRSSMYNES